jgi:hypothetical protein
MLHDLEPLASVLDHFQFNLVGLFEAPDSVAQPLRLIPAVNPSLAQALDPRGTIAL